MNDWLGRVFVVERDGERYHIRLRLASLAVDYLQGWCETGTPGYGSAFRCIHCSMDGRLYRYMFRARRVGLDTVGPGGRRGPLNRADGTRLTCPLDSVTVLAPALHILMFNGNTWKDAVLRLASRPVRKELRARLQAAGGKKVTAKWTGIGTRRVLSSAALLDGMELTIPGAGRVAHGALGRLSFAMYQRRRRGNSDRMAPLGLLCGTLLHR
eukprot:gene2461-9933_t